MTKKSCKKCVKNMIVLYSIVTSCVVSAASDALIKDPAVTLRCKEMLIVRNKKIKMRQKIKALIIRTKKLMKNGPQNEKKALRQLEFTFDRLDKELLLVNLKISRIEEDAIRRGCPGIKL
jgi:Na+/phosphate symporter